MAFKASYVYDIVDRYSGPLSRITKQTKTYNKVIKESVNTVKRLSQKLDVMRKKAGRMGDRLNKTGASMANFRTAVGAAGAAGALKGIINTAVKFEASLNQVEAVTQSSAAGMKLLRDQAKELGRTTQFSAGQAADAMTFLGMAGLKTKDIMKVMPGMLDLAAAGGLQLADAADIATNVLAAFQLPLKRVGHLSDVLAFAAANSNTNIYELSEAMKNTAATAFQAGVSVEETTSLLMLLANAGIKGGEAGTQVMNSFKALSAMAPKTAKGLAKLGIDPKKILDSKGKIKDLTGLIGQLGKKGATMGELFKIFDIRGAKAMAVLKEAGSKSISAFTKQLENADGTAKRMAKTLMKGAPGAIKRFKSAFEGMILTMATVILPTFTKLTEKLATLFSHLQKNNPGLLKMAVIGLVVATTLGAIIVPLGIMLSSMGALISVLPLLLTPLGLLIAGGAALALVFKLTGGSITNLIGHLKNLAVWVKNTFMEVGREKIGAIMAAFKEFGAIIVEQINYFRSLFNMTKMAGNGINWLGVIFATIADVIIYATKTLSFISVVIGTLIAGVIKLGKIIISVLVGGWNILNKVLMRTANLIHNLKKAVAGLLAGGILKIGKTFAKMFGLEGLTEKISKIQKSIKPIEIKTLAKMAKPEAMKAITETTAPEAPKPYLTPRAQLQDMAKSKLAVTQTAKAEISGRIRLEGEQTNKIKSAEFDAPLGNNLEFAY